MDSDADLHAVGNRSAVLMLKAQVNWPSTVKQVTKAAMKI